MIAKFKNEFRCKPVITSQIKLEMFVWRLMKGLARN